MNELPFFSIIIPTYNRPKQLAACIESLTRIEYPRDKFEVIIVDDGSPQPCHQLVAQYRDRLDIALYTKPRSGPAAARNTGALRARGQYLAFTDDDCAPQPDWLLRQAEHFARTPNVLIGGQTINALEENLYAQASQLLVSYLYSYYNALGRPASFFASNNIGMPAELFHRLEGFDTSYPRAAAEDRDFCDRWLQHGYQLIYAADVIIYHAHAMTLSSFWRQHLTYGRGAYRFHRRRAHRKQDKVRVEPLTFYVDLLRYPFAQERLLQALPLAALMGISQGANALGFFWERARLATAQR